MKTSPLLLILTLFFISLLFYKCEPVTTTSVAIDAAPALIENVAEIFTDATTLIETGKSIIGFLNQFNEEDNTLHNQVVDIIDYTNRSDSIFNKSDQIDVIKKWGSDWENIENQFIKLKFTLATVKDTCNKYFRTLEINNHFILDSSIKKDDALKTEELKEKWVKEFETAQTRVNGVGDLIAKARDINIAMTNSIARDSIIASFDKLKEISYEAQSLFEHVNNFSENARKIFENENNHMAVNPYISLTNNKSNLEKNPESQETFCKFNQVRNEFNVFDKNGSKGMLVHINIDLLNLKNINCICSVVIFYENGDKLISKSSGNDYQVEQDINLNPSYSFTSYPDLSTFISFSQFPNSDDNYKTQVILYDNSDTTQPKIIGKSDFLSFKLSQSKYP